MSNIIENKEFDAAEQDAKNAATSYVHKLKTPFTFEEKTYESLTFNWGSLTGSDSLAIEAEVVAKGMALITPEFSGEYLVRMASRACSEPLGSDAIMALPIADFNKIRSKARSFLLNTAL